MFPNENQYSRESRWTTKQRKPKNMAPRKNGASGTINNGGIDDLFMDDAPSADGEARWSDVPRETVAILLAASDNLGAALTLGVTKRKDALLVNLYFREKQNKRYFTWSALGLAELEEFAVALLERTR